MNPLFLYMAQEMQLYILKPQLLQDGKLIVFFIILFLGHVPYNISWNKIILMPNYMQLHGGIHGDREIF